MPNTRTLLYQTLEPRLGCTVAEHKIDAARQQQLLRQHGAPPPCKGPCSATRRGMEVHSALSPLYGSRCTCSLVKTMQIRVAMPYLMHT